MFLFGALALVGWGFVGTSQHPDAYDPWSLRIGASAVLVFAWGVTYTQRGKQGRLDAVLTGCTCVIPAYTFWLVYRNGVHEFTVSAAYIAVIAASGGFFSYAHLAAYSSFVMTAALVLTVAMPALLDAFFLPGMATVLLFINFALRGRTRWHDEHMAAENARVQARAANDTLRVRDEYMAIISHEVKTPVTSIKLRTQMLLRKLHQHAGEAVPYERVERFAKETDAQATRLTNLVDDMLDLSRLTNGRLPFHREPMTLSDVVDAALRSLDDAFVNAGCALQAHVQPQVMVEGDRRRLEQVVLNLLTNAIKYGRGTPVHVTLETHGDDVILRVRDFGMGVAKSDQARIFERFERAISARHVSGLGLGLFICNEIVVSHGGRITLESDVGKGACFTVTLPTLASTDVLEPNDDANQSTPGDAAPRTNDA